MEGGGHRSLGSDVQPANDRPCRFGDDQELFQGKRNHGAAVRERILRERELVRVPRLFVRKSMDGWETWM